ncbi:MAG: OmpP1/FadL family transporter [Pelagimonas sp.]|uniref:OmpP1/FadL family transporter n=1 Tax=Pelagimonas sp. TaxID=2073170 RepID=UPI003D6A9FAF
MKKTLMTASAVAMTASIASAGGIERATNDYSLLFKEGDVASVSVSLVNPTVTGKFDTGAGSQDSGNVANDYTSLAAVYKRDFGEKMSFGLFLNTPYGADAAYSDEYYTGLAAEWDSQQIAAVLRYGITDRVSVYGGARYVTSSADITIPGLAFVDGARDGQARETADAAQLAALGGADPSSPYHAEYVKKATNAATLGLVLASYDSGSDILDYTAEGKKTGDWGFILGAAYEIPDIALRVGVTWESSITHTFDTHEVLRGLGIDTNSKTEVEMPQSVTLDFQSGVAKDTLVFGSVKWTEWSKWEVRPDSFDALTGQEITGYENDTTTWRIGVGRKFNENASGFAQVRYEKAHGGEASRLAPTDGMIAFGIGGQFTKDNVSLRGGMEYVKLGDAEVSDGAKFEGNSAIGFGLALTVSF